jgi:hypothetical protein
MQTAFTVDRSPAWAWGLDWLTAVPASWAADNFTATSPPHHFGRQTGQGQKTQTSQSPQAARPAGNAGRAENKAERDKRLLRECRGKTNAGACEGYAS